MAVVTRFAPSPTGFLHIGGARTALFNWLFARRHSGRYLLRIEDTDRQRSTKEAIEAIIDGLSWLGLDADGPPIFQFARAQRHREVAEEMVARGQAFRCYVTAEELETRRNAGEAAREKLREAIKAEAAPDTIAALRRDAEALTSAFRSPYRDGDKPPAPDAPFVIRLRAPDQGEIAHDDLIQGHVAVKADELDDLVLLRADGTPTYMHAVVVDDHDMDITHVIRGDDHLTNTARQIPIYRAMGWEIPTFAHVPMIHGPDGAKLSKRHGALAVQGYRDMGYLPEGLNNYLMRLGWSHGDDEIMSLADASRWFDLDHVGKSPSRLDLAKLDFVNGHYMRTADDHRLADLLLAHVAAHRDWTLDEETRERVVRAIPVLKMRAKTILELAEQTYFLLRRRPLQLDAAAQKAMKEDVTARLRRLRPLLAAAPVWDEASLAQKLKDFASAEGVGMGQIGPGLRAALTGGSPAPDLGQTLALLGREEALGRLEDAL